MFSQKVLDAVIVTVLLAIALAFYGCMSTARAHDIYAGWKQPKYGMSCCSSIEKAGGDCAPAKAEYRDGKWFAQSHWDKSWVEVPDDTILKDKDSPDGRSHLCIRPVNNRVLCFLPGLGI